MSCVTCATTLLTRLRSRCKLSKLQLGDFRRKLLHNCCNRAAGTGGGEEEGGEAWQLGCPAACFVATCNLQRAQCGLIKYDKYETRARVSTAERMPRHAHYLGPAPLTTPLQQSELIKLQWRQRINF